MNSTLSKFNRIHSVREFEHRPEIVRPTRPHLKSGDEGGAAIMDHTNFSVGYKIRPKNRRRLEQTMTVTTIQRHP